MPVSPDVAGSLAQGMLNLYAHAEAQVMRTIARRLAQGADAPDWATRQLGTLQSLMLELRPLVAAITASSADEVEYAVRSAWNRGSALALADLPGIGPAGRMGGVNRYAVQALVDRGNATMAAIGSQMLPRAEATAANAVRYASGMMLGGAVTQQVAQRRAVIDMADRGLTGFRDSSGRGWSLSAYAEMATRTITAQAVIQGHVEQLASYGFDLVQVSRSLEPCDKCGPFEGKVLSARGQTPVGRQRIDGVMVHVLDTLNGATSKGLHHPNCTHRTKVFIPGVSKPDTDPPADPEQYRLRQQQRAQERRIRQLARRVEALQGFGDDAALSLARGQLRDYRAKHRDWLALHNRKRLPARESARWEDPRRRVEVPGQADELAALQRAQGVTVQQQAATIAQREQQIRSDAAAAAEAQRGRDMATMTDDDLDAAFRDALAADDDQLIDRLAGEMDRRQAMVDLEARTRTVRDSSDDDLRQQLGEAQAGNRWDLADVVSREIARRQRNADRRDAAREKREREFDERYRRALADGADEEHAYAEAMGTTVEKLRRDAFRQERGEATFAAAVSAEFNDRIGAAYLLAENECRGHMLSDEGKRKIGSRSWRALWTMNEATARRWASEELRGWWDRNGRLTKDDVVFEIETGRTQQYGGPDFLA